MFRLLTFFCIFTFLVIVIITSLYVLLCCNYLFHLWNKHLAVKKVFDFWFWKAFYTFILNFSCWTSASNLQISLKMGFPHVWTGIFFLNYICSAAVMCLFSVFTDFSSTNHALLILCNICVIHSSIHYFYI